jgi:hypothetical protein
VKAKEHRLRLELKPSVHMVDAALEELRGNLRDMAKESGTRGKAPPACKLRLTCESVLVLPLDMCQVVVVMYSRQDDPRVCGVANRFYT